MSAVYRLMPRPPARVDRRNTNFSLPSRLYSSIWLSRSSPLVLPAHAHALPVTPAFDCSLVKGRLSCSLDSLVDKTHLHGCENGIAVYLQESL